MNTQVKTCKHDKILLFHSKTQASVDQWLR